MQRSILAFANSGSEVWLFTPSTLPNMR